MDGKHNWPIGVGARVRVNGRRKAKIAMNSGRAVIINGDDFGRSAEINAGILRAHREGVLNSASLMVAEAASDAAARAAKDNPGLDVGLHLVVCLGSSVLAPARLAGLVDANRAFTNNPVFAGMRYFFDRRIRDALRAECRAQVEKHLELVGYLNHIDGHLNFHVHPVLADILIELAAEHRVPCVRLPRERVMTTVGLAKDHLVRKLVEAVIFRALSARAQRLMTARGIKSTDWLFGLHQSGHLSERYLLGVIERLPPGVTELYFHPAEDLGQTPPPAGAQLELKLLIGAELRRALSQRDIKIANWKELAGSPDKSAVRTNAGS